MPCETAGKGRWVRERRDGERSSLHAPHRRRTPFPAPEQRKKQWGREPTAPAEGRGRAAARQTPRFSLFLPGAGRDSAAAGPTGNPVPPRGTRRAEGRSGGGRSPGTASSQSYGETLLAAAGSHPPLPPGRLPLPWPPSPPARRSRARRSLPPSPSSRCMGFGAERGAEPSGGAAAARRLTRSPPAAIPPAARALNPCGAAQAGLPSRAAPCAGRGERVPPPGARASPPTRSPSSIRRPGDRRRGSGTSPRAAGAQWWRRGVSPLPGPHARIALLPIHPRGLAAAEGKERLWMGRKNRELQWVGLPDP